MKINNSGDNNEPVSPLRASRTVSGRSLKLAAKGHRNLFIRGTTTLMNAIVTAVLISYNIDVMHQPFLLVCQLVGSASLYIQWRTGRPSMFIVRGCASFMQSIIVSHAIICGRRWYFWDDCVEEAWTDVRRPLRVVASLTFVRLICNGMSLFCQFRYPHRMLGGRGNEQLFYRGCIQATGVPMHLISGIHKIAVLSGTTYERLPAEIVGNFFNAFVSIPIASASLFHQWWMTKKGATGHATSDAYERLMDPSIDCPLQRIKVTILSARGLRNADWGGLSDPFCICEVVGRPESTWQTKHIDNTLEPDWNESRELETYRLHDALKFSIQDFDEHHKCSCCHNQHDPLGDVTLKSGQFHPDGFDGVLTIEGVGKGRNRPTLRVKVDILDAGHPIPVHGLTEMACPPSQHRDIFGSFFSNREAAGQEEEHQDMLKNPLEELEPAESANRQFVERTDVASFAVAKPTIAHGCNATLANAVVPERFSGNTPAACHVFDTVDVDLDEFLQDRVESVNIDVDAYLQDL